VLWPDRASLMRALISTGVFEEVDAMEMRLCSGSQGVANGFWVLHELDDAAVLVDADDAEREASPMGIVGS